jgi:L-ascorbate metabolism protein UlaG (beta-lactamase superfamily)
VNRPTRLPDLITMNNAHITHYTNNVPPEIKTVLRGWNTGSGIPRHDVMLKDARIRSIPTNFGEMGGGTNGNSVWVVEAAGLCIAHLSHLHHTVSREHVAALGPIDVLLAPIDGRVTMSHDELIDTIRQINALATPLSVNLGIGEPNLVPDARLRELAQRAATTPWQYSPNAGNLSLRKKVCERTAYDPNSAATAS